MSVNSRGTNEVLATPFLLASSILLLVSLFFSVHCDLYVKEDIAVAVYPADVDVLAVVGNF